MTVLGNFKRSNIDYTNIEIQYENDKAERILISPSYKEKDEDIPLDFKIDFDNINDYI